MKADLGLLEFNPRFFETDLASERDLERELEHLLHSASNANTIPFPLH